MNFSATTQLFLYSERFDFEPYHTRPTKMVCFPFVPRSGSTLLACLLAQTKAFGFPLEYFSPVNIPAIRKRLPDFKESYVNGLFKIRTTGNGIFSYKLDANSLNLSLDTSISPGFFFVIDRKDRFAQAKSFAKARLTNEWVLSPDVTSSFPSQQVTHKQIESAEEELQKHRDKIYDFVYNSGTPVMQIDFEQVIQSPQKMVDSIIEFTGMRNNYTVDINDVPIAKQS